MPVGRTKKLEIAQRRQRVLELYLENWTQVEIAAELDVSQSTVSTDIKAIEKELRDSAVRDLELDRAVELRRLDRVERAAWDLLQRSGEPIESTRVVQNDSGGRRVEKRVTQQHGDRRYLELILRVSQARRQLLGLDAPTPSASTSPNGRDSNQPIKVSWDELLDRNRPKGIDYDPIEREIEAIGE